MLLILLFETLQLCFFMKFLWENLRYSTHIQKLDFLLSASNQSLWNFLQLSLGIHKKCQLQGLEHFYVMEARKMAIFLPPFWSISRCPPEKFYDIWAQLTKNFIKNWKTFTFYWPAFVKLESENFTTSLIKSWGYEFSSLIDLKGIKKFIIASAKIFWPWRPGRLQSGREHMTYISNGKRQKSCTLIVILVKCLYLTSPIFNSLAKSNRTFYLPGRKYYTYIYL